MHETAPVMSRAHHAYLSSHRTHDMNPQRVLMSIPQPSDAALESGAEPRPRTLRYLAPNAHRSQSLELADSLLLSRLLLFPCSKCMRCLQSLQMESSSSIVTVSLKTTFMQWCGFTWQGPLRCSLRWPVFLLMLIKYFLSGSVTASADGSARSSGSADGKGPSTGHLRPSCLTPSICFMTLWRRLTSVPDPPRSSTKFFISAMASSSLYSPPSPHVIALHAAT